MSVNTLQLSHIKQSVLGPGAFDSFISAWVPEGLAAAASFSLSVLERGKQTGPSWQSYEACSRKTTRACVWETSDYGYYLLTFTFHFETPKHDS